MLPINALNIFGLAGVSVRDSGGAGTERGFPQKVSAEKKIIFTVPAGK